MTSLTLKSTWTSAVTTLTTVVLLLIPAAVWAAPIPNKCLSPIVEEAAPEAAPFLSSLPINFHKVTDRLYRGSRITGQIEADALAQLGVKTVINLQGGDETDSGGQHLFGRAHWQRDLPRVESGETTEDIQEEGLEFERAGILPDNYHSIPLDSLSKVNSVELIKIQQILEIINDPSTPQPIYIHCAHGADRTGLIAALFRVLSQNYCIKDAHEEWEKLGHDWEHTLFTGRLDIFFSQYLRQHHYNFEKTPN